LWTCLACSEASGVYTLLIVESIQYIKCAEYAAEYVLKNCSKEYGIDDMTLRTRNDISNFDGCTVA